MFVKRNKIKTISEGEASAKLLPLWYFGVSALCHIAQGVIHKTVWHKRGGMNQSKGLTFVISGKFYQRGKRHFINYHEEILVK